MGLSECRYQINQHANQSAAHDGYKPAQHTDRGVHLRDRAVADQVQLNFQGARSVTGIGVQNGKQSRNRSVEPAHPGIPTRNPELETTIQCPRSPFQ
jgi:hypothetical protein